MDHIFEQTFIRKCFAAYMYPCVNGLSKAITNVNM